MRIISKYAGFAEQQRGSLTLGKPADMVLLDRDLTAIPVAEIPTTAVRTTVVGGEVVYSA